MRRGVMRRGVMRRGVMPARRNPYIADMLRVAAASALA